MCLINAQGPYKNTTALNSCTGIILQLSLQRHFLLATAPCRKRSFRGQSENIFSEHDFFCIEQNSMSIILLLLPI